MARAVITGDPPFPIHLQGDRAHTQGWTLISTGCCLIALKTVPRGQVFYYVQCSSSTPNSKSCLQNVSIFALVTYQYHPLVGRKGKEGAGVRSQQSGAEPEFRSPHPHGVCVWGGEDSKQPGTRTPGNRTPLGLCWHLHTQVHKYTYMNKTLFKKEGNQAGTSTVSSGPKGLNSERHSATLPLCDLGLRFPVSKVGLTVSQD